MLSRVRERPNVLASLVMMAAFGLLFVVSLDFPRTARLFPVAIGITGFVLSSVQFVLDVVRQPKALTATGGGDLRPDDDLSVGDAIKSVRWEFAWLVGVVLGAVVVGPIPALLTYLVLYVGRRRSWRVAVLTTAVFAMFWLGIFGILLGSGWPQGIFSEPQATIVRQIMRLRGLF